MERNDPFSILVAEDSAIDRMLLHEAFEELDFQVRLVFVGDGQELLDYLRERSPPVIGEAARLPTLVLMDLNMPRMKGIEALIELRADASLRVLPVIALSTSNSPRQIAQAYACGVNAYLIKPEHFDDFVDLLKTFGSFWLRKAKLPNVLTRL